MGNNNGVLMEPPPLHTYPIEYGLPKSLNVATLVRRSPSYPVQQGSAGAHGIPTSISSSSTNTLPPSYDLAKYPKEYINPQQSSISYVYPEGMGTFSGQLMCPTGNKNEFYPAYILSPEGYVTNFAGEEYTVATMSGVSYSIENVGPPTPSVPVPINCSCAPILEASESEEKVDAEVSTQSVPTQTMSEAGATDNGPNNVSKKASNVDTITSSSSSSSNASTAIGASNINNKSNVTARLQRQLSTQINESPDEGYEDESAEGTEIW